MIPNSAKPCSGRLEDTLDRPMRFMEVCGTHTVSIFRGGLRTLLPEQVTHLTGPAARSA